MSKADLDQNLNCTTSTFSKHFHSVLQNHAPIKKKILQFNNSPFMTKTLKKVIMHRSKLGNIYSKKQTNDYWANYKKQMNFYVNLLRKAKKGYFQNSNIQDLSDNRKFWKIIKPCLTDKGLNPNKLLLKEKVNNVSNKKQLATIINSFFFNITKGLELKDESNANTLENVLDDFNSHPSIERIRRTVETNQKFSFQPVPEDLVSEIILNLGRSKATPVKDLPAYMLKSTIDTHLSIIIKITNFSFKMIVSQMS